MRNIRARFANGTTLLSPRISGMFPFLVALFVANFGQPITILAGEDPVFDLKSLLAPPLNARTLKTTESEGIVTEEVMFHSEIDQGKSVDIFGLFSYPKRAAHLPAMIWNQGGLSQATPYWTEFAARRGYAALCIDFPLPGYRSTGGYPINSGVDLTDDPRQAPIYHGAVALLRAVSFLESRSEVNKDRIGMAGSSWGGFYTTLMIGIDSRLKVGSCMFGCGALQLGNSWWDNAPGDNKRDTAFRERWAATLDPASRLAKSKTPIAWITGTNDSFYWLPAVMKSHELAAGPKHLSLLANWNHALTPTLDEQVFAWLDVHLKDADKFLEVGTLAVTDDGIAHWQVRGPRQPTRATILASYGEAGHWASRYWIETDAALDGDQCTASLPKSGLPGFAVGTVYDQNGFCYSTPVVKIKATAPNGITPRYNGCSLWGNFDKPGQDFLKLHGLPVPSIKESSDGLQVELSKGKHTFGPILYTADTKHLFQLNVTATQATTVTISLQGTFDGKRLSESRPIEARSDVQEVTIPYVPPAALSGGLHVEIDVPAESIRISQMRFLSQ